MRERIITPPLPHCSLFAGTIIMSLLQLIVSVLISANVAAHDFWIEPSTFQPEPGDVVDVSLKIGDHFIGYPFPRDPHHAIVFDVWTDQGSRPVEGIVGQTPAGRFVVPEGTSVVGYLSKTTTVSIEADVFENYLREAGLQEVISRRAEEGTSTKEGVEAYARYAKSILSSGDGAGTEFDRVLGFEFEIVPEQDPYAAWQDHTFPVRLLYLHRPAAGIQVSAIHESEFEPTTSGITDTDGRVVLSIDRPGVWMITSVHMIDAPAGSSADWRSYWASLTFERPPSPAPDHDRP